jgi:putative aldouronate transport system substrate-binding protein
MKKFFVLFLMFASVFLLASCEPEIVEEEPKGDTVAILGDNNLVVNQEITLSAEEGGTWTSSDGSVAKVVKSVKYPHLAYVTGLKVGKTTISVTKGTEDKGTFEIEVKAGTGTPLNLAVTYQKKAYLSYIQTKPYVAPNGKTYVTGDLLPGIVEYAKRTGTVFNDETPQGKTEAEILADAAIGGFVRADIYNGKVTDINKYGVLDQFVALNDYLDQMPNLKAFLAKNEALKLSLEASDGNMYYAPYFDGMDEVERSFFLRHDWVEKLLDGTPAYDTAKTVTTVYSPYYSKGFDTAVKGTTKDINKKYTAAQNPVALQNALAVKNGKTLAEVLVNHIKDRYGNQFAKPSDLFLSGNASYDADELIALFRAVKANPLLLTGNADTDIEILLPRDTDDSRTTMITAFASIWGVRGTNGDNTFYINNEGKLVDGSAELKNFEAMEMLNELYQEGLILKEYKTIRGSVKDWRSQYMYTEGKGFMTFDYNQSTTALYDSKKVAESTAPALAGHKVRAVLPPVADWDDGVTGNYVRFSEFSRAIKTEGWGISANAAKDPAKLAAALRVVDYPYSDRGEVLVTWGPDEWIDGTLEYVSTSGTEIIPKISALAAGEINTLASGNLTNYYRLYVGSTYAIGHVRHMGFEYQILNADGLASADLINAAISAGALEITKSTYNPDKGYFYLTPPSTWALTKTEIDKISSEAADATNVYKNNKHNFVMYGTGNLDPSLNKVLTWSEYTAALTAAKYNSVYFANHNAAWNRMKLKYLEK